MKVKVRVIGDYAVGNEKGQLIVKPGTLVLDEVEAGRLVGRNLVEIVGPAEERQTEEDVTQRHEDTKQEPEEKEGAKENREAETKTRNPQPVTRKQKN